MKAALLLSYAVTALLLGKLVFNQEQRPPDFSGRWALETQSGADLPYSLKNAKTLTMTVKQDEKQLRVENEITWGAANQGAGIRSTRGRYSPPGSSGRAPVEDKTLAAALVPPVVTYDLNGQERQAVIGTDSPALVKLKAQWLIIGENQVLQLNSAQSVVAQGRDVVVTNRQRWTLAPDGKTLKVELYTTPPGEGEISSMRFYRLPP